MRKATAIKGLFISLITGFFGLLTLPGLFIVQLKEITLPAHVIAGLCVLVISIVLFVGFTVIIFRKESPR